MDIYFDFEATQFSDCIISIGATCDYGDFECLISGFEKKITPFITQLTGITKEMVQGAPNANEAFIDLWQWLLQMNRASEGEPVFYHCYGDADRGFLRNTANKIEARPMANFVNKLADSIIDDSKQVCRFFHAKQIGVYKALSYFNPELPEQDHDALNDAIALRQLMEHISKANPIEEYPFLENNKIVKITAPKPKGDYLIVATCMTDVAMKPRFFDSYGEACDWLFKRIQKKAPMTYRDNVLKRMKKAIDSSSEYAGFHWVRENVKE